MRIRHLVALDNLDLDGVIVDPCRVRHGLVVGGHVAELAGEIDPLTHLNLDFPDHSLDECLVAARLEVGAPVLYDDDIFRLTVPRPDAYTHLGRVNTDTRRAQWQRQILNAKTPRGKGA